MRLNCGTSYRSHGDNVTFRIAEPNLETFKLQWTFFSGVKRFPDSWRRYQYFGYNSVIYTHYVQIIIKMLRMLLGKLIKRRTCLSRK
jgi:hypothetical protein